MLIPTSPVLFGPEPPFDTAQQRTYCRYRAEVFYLRSVHFCFMRDVSLILASICRRERPLYRRAC